MAGALSQLVESIHLGGGLGIPVRRVAAADPQNAWQSIFAIQGTIIVRALIGIRTVIQAGGASTMQFRHSVGPTVLDAGTLSVAAHAVGALYNLSGDTTDPIRAGVAGAAAMMGRVVATSTTYGALGLFVLTGGNIQVTMTAAAGTGSTGYVLIYVPVSEGANVAVA